MRARISALVCAVALVATAASASAQEAIGATPTDGASEDLGRARSELADARTQLGSGAERLRAVRDELERIDARLVTANADLAAVHEQLATAQEAHAAASAEQLEAAAALAAAGEDLADEVAAWQSAEDQLRSRVADAYKHGGMASSRYLVSGIARSQDMHDVARTMHTVEAIVAREREAVTEQVETTRATAAARSGLVDLRTSARRAQQTAAREEARVEQLLDRTERIVADIEGERTEREQLVAELAADQAATQALVDELARRVADLQSALADAWLREVTAVPVDGPAPAWAAALPGRGRPWAATVEAAAASSGVDGRLLAALVWTESNFDPRAVSHAGALGMAQLMPGTAAGLGVDPRDPLQNMVGGGRYLRAQLVRFGRVDLALAAYNAGPGRVTRAGLQVPRIVETQLYVVKVLERYERLAAAG